jgi:hypothetical protein
LLCGVGVDTASVGAPCGQGVDVDRCFTWNMTLGQGALRMFHVKHLEVFGLPIVSRETNPQPNKSRVCREAHHARAVFRGVKTEAIQEVGRPSRGVQNGRFGHD